MSECSILLQEYTFDDGPEAILQRILEENRLKQMALDKASCLIQNLTEEIGSLKKEVEMLRLREKRLLEEARLMHEEAENRLLRQIKEKDKVIGGLEEMIKQQQRDKIQQLFNTKTKVNLTIDTPSSVQMQERKRIKTQWVEENTAPKTNKNSQSTIKTIDDVRKSLKKIRENYLHDNTTIGRREKSNPKLAPSIDHQNRTHNTPSYDSHHNRYKYLRSFFKTKY